MKTDPIDLIPLPLIFLDKDFVVLSWNKAAEKILQLKDKKYLSQSINDAFNHPNLVEQLETRKQRASSEPVLLTYRQMDLSLSVTDDGDQGYLLIVENVTKIRRLERMRQDFVANVSHELRTPLTVLHGYLEILIERADDVLSSYKKTFEQMYQQSSRMESLIKELLLLSRLENDTDDKDRFQIIDVFPLLEKICNDAKTLSGNRQHKIILKADKHLKIYGLENFLISIFSNLIFNAINYTPAKGKITISWQKDGDKIYFEVSDTGIGMEKKHIPRITERFYRIDKARSRTSGGTGLGLAIVKHALLLHKATLKIESEIGKGSTFTCIFPYTGRL
ncbi:MAG: histidine kinase [Gammaproteobacteria bacterium]|jgi:two-component system phosphate regulon sensor histidine kinase PhoR|nr:histidine kinase [Gammaproteobacteria bacterium]